jgi:hypothetical protein
MREFTQDGMFNELSKVTRAFNKSKYEKMDLPRYGNGGEDPVTNSQVDSDKDYYIRMANSPLFVERYARMVGKPVDQVTEEAEAYRKDILNNLDTLKLNDVGVLPKGIRKRDVWGINGEYSAPLTNEVVAKAQKTIDEIPKFIRKPFQNKLDKEIANYPEHEIFLYVDDPWTKTHETSHASVKGTIHNKNVNKYSFHDLIEALPSERLYKNDEEYYTMPDEQKARIDVTRKYLENKGLYDPVNEPFTQKHYDLLRNEYIKNLQGQNKDFPHNVEDLMIPYDEDTTIKMFNNFVSNDQKKDITQAKLGGLAKFIGGGSNNCPQGLVWDEKLQDCVRPMQQMEEVLVTPVTIYTARYQDQNPYEEFFAKKKAEYIKKAGNFGKITNLEVNFPDAQIKKIKDEYEYNKNNYVASKLGYDYEDREKWVDKISPAARAVLQNSEYASKLQPSLWAKTNAGFRALANTLLPGQPISYNVKGLSPKEEAEYKKDKFAAFDATAFADIPGAVVFNALADARPYAKNPGVLSGEVVNKAGEMGASLLNPLVPIEMATGISLAPDLIELGLKGAQGAYRTSKKLAKSLNIDELPLQVPASINPASPANDIDYTQIRNINDLDEELRPKGYRRSMAYDPDEINNFIQNNPNNVKSIVQENWPDLMDPNLKNREAQQELFDLAGEFANKWYKKDPKAYDEAVINLSQENKKGYAQILDQKDQGVINAVESEKQKIRDIVFKNNNVNTSQYFASLAKSSDDGTLAKMLDEQIESRYLTSLKNNPEGIKTYEEYQKAIKKLQDSEDVKLEYRQNIVDNLDPDFKRKVEGLYELSEQPHPDLIQWTSPIQPTSEHLVHMGVDEPSFKALTDESKQYLNKNSNNIGGVKMGTGETITLGSRESDTKNLFFLEPDVKPELVKTVRERSNRFPVRLSNPSTWHNIFNPKITKNIYEIPKVDDSEKTLLEVSHKNMKHPQSVAEVNAHEIGHDQQKVANWVNLIQEDNQNFKYFTNHDKNELAKAFKESMVEPTAPVDGKYTYESWKSGVGELHSELNMSRLNAAQYYMQQGYTMDEAIQLLKQYEAEGNDELYDFYINSSGDLNKHFKPDVDFKTKKTLLQVLPMVGATVLTGKKLFENEESPLPSNQKYGGNISNLQKFIR